jgi:hypothetical protein
MEGNVSMSEREKLLSFLFDRDDGKELKNLKFFAPRSADSERAAAAARRVLENLWSGREIVSVLPPTSNAV